MNITSVVLPEGEWFGVNPTPLEVEYNAENNFTEIEFTEVGQVNGLAKIFLLNANDNYLYTNDYVIIEEGIYKGTHKIIFSEPFYDFIIINTDFTEDSNGFFKKSLNNYNIVTNVISGLPTDHAYHAQKPAKFLSSLRAELDFENKAKINVSPILKADFDYENNFCKYIVPSTLNLLSVDFDRFSGFSFEYAQKYEVYFLGTAYENENGFVSNGGETEGLPFNNDFDFSEGNASVFWNTQNTFGVVASDFDMTGANPLFVIPSQNANTFTLYQNAILTKDTHYLFRVSINGLTDTIAKANLIINNKFIQQKLVIANGITTIEFRYKATQTKNVNVGLFFTEVFGDNFEVLEFSYIELELLYDFKYVINGSQGFEDTQKNFDNFPLSETNTKEFLSVFSSPFPIDKGAERSYSFLTASNSELLLYFLSNLAVTLSNYTLYRLNIAKYILLQEQTNLGIILDEEGEPILDESGDYILDESGAVIEVGKLAYDTGTSIKFIEFDFLEYCKITQNISFLNSYGGFDYVVFSSKREVSIDTEDGEDLQTSSVNKYFKNTITSKESFVNTTLVKRGLKQNIMPILTNITTAIKAYKAGLIGSECETKFEVLIDSDSQEFFEDDRIMELEISYKETAPKNTQSL